MKATSIRGNQAKSTKPSLPNKVYQTEQIQNKLVNQSEEGSNQSPNKFNHALSLA